MRFYRTLVLLGVLVVFWLIGPWVLVAALLAVLIPPVRRRLRPSWRQSVFGVAVVAVLVAIVVAVPDGRLRIPPGAGVLVTPSYVGRPATAHPIDLTLAQAPGLAPNGRSSMHNDAGASDAYAGPGPLGLSPEVDSSWLGLEECATMGFDSRERMVALCGDLRGPTLRVIDTDSLRSLAAKELPKRQAVEGKKPWENLCGGAYFYLDPQDRAVVATTDRRIVVIGTRDGQGDPDLTVERSYDLSAQITGEQDCLIALMPDFAGNTWWVTQGGIVGTLSPAGVVTSRDLGAGILNSIAADAQGVYVVTDEALVKLALAPDGTPTELWRTSYDAGSQRKPGQLSQGSGTTPTLTPSGLVAITDNADPRMHVQFYDPTTGRLACEAPVFGKGESASDNSLVVVGESSVVVENNYGYGSPLRTVLGRATPGGLARVDASGPGGGTCAVAWTSDEIAPSSVAKASLATGLVYAYTKRPNRWGADAWYLTAIDARTGRTAFGVRTGLGSMFNNHYAAVTLGPDGAAYVATLAGLVRVRDTD